MTTLEVYIERSLTWELIALAAGRVTGTVSRPVAVRDTVGSTSRGVSVDPSVYFAFFPSQVLADPVGG